MLRMFLSVCTLAACLGTHPLFAQSATSPADTRAPKPAVMVNLNTATVAELTTLPGVGPRLAERIIEYRQKKGPFKKIEEIMNVQGVGEKSFLKLKPQITVTSSAPASNQH